MSSVIWLVLTAAAPITCVRILMMYTKKSTSVRGFGLRSIKMLPLFLLKYSCRLMEAIN